MRRYIFLCVCVVALAFAQIYALPEDEVQWQVKVLSASHLQDSDWGIFFRDPDSYVIVSYRPNVKSPFRVLGQTPVRKNTENPKWNSTFSILLKPDADKSGGNFKFTLMDKDLISDDPKGILQMPVKPTGKVVEKKFTGAKKACLKFEIIALAKPLAPTKADKGIWEVTLVEGKELPSQKKIAVGYRQTPKQQFSYVGSTPPIEKSDQKWDTTLKVNGTNSGTFAFLVSGDKKVSEKDWENAALLDAASGEYHVRLPDAKKAYVEVVLKFSAKK